MGEEDAVGIVTGRQKAKKVQGIGLELASLPWKNQLSYPG
jgi:hypothetical protein